MAVFDSAGKRCTASSRPGGGVKVGRTQLYVKGMEYDLKLIELVRGNVQVRPSVRQNRYFCTSVFFVSRYNIVR